MSGSVRRKAAVCLLIAVLASMAAGCWDSQQLEQRTIVAAMALDMAGDEYEVTLQAPVPAKIVGGGGDGGGGGGGGKGGPGAVQLFSGKGKSLAEAILDVQSRVNFPLFYGHAQMILLSEEVARRGIGDFLDYMRRYPEFRRRLWPLVVKGKAKDGLMIQTRLEQIPTYYLRDMIETNVTAGRSPDQALGDVYINISDPYRRISLLNLIVGMESDYILKGLAVLDGERMVWSISHPLANPVFHIVEAKRGWNMVVPCPDGQGNVIFHPTGVKRKITVSGKPAVDIRVEVEGNIIEKTCGVNLSRETAAEELARQVAKSYEGMAAELVEEAYRKRRIDLFRIGSRVHAFQPKLEKKIDWLHSFSTIPVTVRYDVQIRRIGLEAQ